MGVYSTATSTIIERVAHRALDLVGGTTFTAESGTTTTAVCSYLLEADDYYNGFDLSFYEGTHKDTQREITDWVQSTKTLTFSPAITASADTTDKFLITRRWKWKAYLAAVNAAIDAIKDEYLLDLKDETTALVTDTQEYSVPTGFRYIWKMYLEDLVTADLFEECGLLTPEKWNILKHATTPKIKFDERYFDIGSAFNGKNVRIIGQKMQSNVTLNADIIYLPPEWVTLRALHILFMSKKEDQAMADYFFKQAEVERRRNITAPYAGSKSIYEA